MARFHYNASSLALGGQYRRGRDLVTISGTGALILPNTGGQASCEVVNFDYGGVSFARSTAHATGRLVEAKDGVPASYRTELSFRLENLRILDTVQVEYLALRIASLHPAPAPPLSTQTLADDGVRIEVGPESGFGAITIAGVPLKIRDRVPEFGRGLATYAGILNDEKRSGRNVAGRATIDSSLIEAAAATDAASGLAFRDGVSKQRGGDERQRFISIPRFGRLFLGEVLADKHTRRINLLRLELDSNEGRRAPSAAKGRAKRGDERDGEQLAGDIASGLEIINGSSYP